MYASKLLLFSSLGLGDYAIPTGGSYGKNHLLNPARCNTSAIFSFREQDKRHDEGATTPKRRLSASLFAFTLEWSL